MSEENRCPQCGAVLPAHVPQGICPGCLLKRGLESQTAASQEGSGPAEGHYVPPTPAELAPYFPDLEILELVGRGGMGVVYKARQKRLDRLVALKILAPKIGQDPAFAERFAREARAMAMLSHPHIVAVHDFGQTDGLYYFLMEFVDGVNLRRLLDAGKLAPEEALAIVPQICEALQYAHDHGVVHRDIKPENVLLDKEGRVKIADFGIAKLVGKEAKDLTLTGEGQIMGTLQYMAPEQIEHPLQVDHRADIYSLGVVFYQMLTGELPIGRFAPPSRKVQIDVRLDEVVLRALEKEPERRYQQASEIKTRMETIVGTPSPGVTNGSPYGLVSRRNGERVINWRAVVTLSLIVTGFILAGEVVFSLLLSPEWSRERLPWFMLSAVTFALLFVFGGLYRAFQVPLEGLTPVDSSAPHPEATVEDVALEQAGRQVKGPAIGMVVTGVFNWLVVIPVVIWALLPMVADLTAHNRPGALLVFIPLSLMALSSLMIFAALKMKRLQAYWSSYRRQHSGHHCFAWQPDWPAYRYLGAGGVEPTRRARGIQREQSHQDRANAAHYRQREKGRDRRPCVMFDRLSAHAAAGCGCRKELVGMDFPNADLFCRPRGADLRFGRPKVRCWKGCHCHLKPGRDCRRGVSVYCPVFRVVEDSS